MIEPEITVSFIDSEDCQGNPERYYRGTAWLSNGQCVMGVGYSADEAKKKTLDNYSKAYHLLQCDPRTQLDLICDKKEIYYQDMRMAIRAINRILKGQVQ
jgi:hypothetical protein